MTAPKSESQQQPEESSQKLYRALVVDSGPIIKFQANDLNNSATAFYTVPGVLQEIKDAKARHQTLPFELKTREPSPESLTKIIEFARKTGDYPSLSSVDLQVLALVYELEKEGCGGVMDHIRTTPKRMLGQSIKAMNAKKKKNKKKNQDAANDSNNNNTDKDESVNKNKDALNHFSEISADDIEFGDDDDREDSDDEEETKQEDPPAPKNTTTPSSWAKLVNPGDPTESSPSRIPVQQQWTIPKQNDDDNSAAGQFSDAEEDDEIGDLNMNQISLNTNAAADTVDNVLEEAFPSLQESLQVPYEEEECPALLAKQEAEQQRLEALQVKSKSGKQYNSFRKYGELVKPKQMSSSTEETAEEEESVVEEDEKHQQGEGTGTVSNTQSRINMGQTTGQNAMHAFEDDGEGWVTSTKDIRNMKSAGRLNPTTDPSKVLPQEGKKTNLGPPMHQRTACATTDFAMQNVLLQMKLELVSVDGMKIRRLKSWVQRCGACFKVYYSTGNRMLFCAHCGSDMMQRVAASVTGNGRVRLHLKKGYQHNIRGTKYSLPKAGRNDRFQGDLLLREDQLFMRGAWNTKVKKSSAKSNKAVASLFGSDLAEHVGCNSFASDGDIKVGFGRRNPNAAKGGRERRGKKKKSGHKACGLRRY